MISVATTGDMSMLTLIAVDANDTQVREDGFLLDLHPKEPDVLKRLTVSSVLPSLKLQAQPENLLRNLLRVERDWEPLLFHHEAQTRSKNLGLFPAKEQQVLSAVFEMRKGREFFESLKIEEAIITPFTFAQFQEQPTFKGVKKHLEEFIAQDAHVWYRYSQKEERRWDEDTAAHRLIAALNELFNRTCSYYAESKKIVTVRKKGVEISCREHRGGVASFNAPFRKAESFLNLQNLTAHLLNQEPPHTPDSISKIGISL